MTVCITYTVHTRESSREELCHIAELSPEFAELSSNFPGEPALLSCKAKL